MRFAHVHSHFAHDRLAGAGMSNRAAGHRIVVNLLVGPPIGSCVIFAWALVHNEMSGRGTSFGDGAVAGIVMVFMLGYLVGFLPALLNGLFTAWLFPRLIRRSERLLASLLTGGLSALAVMGWLTLGAWQSDSGDNGFVVLGMMALTGALASLGASIVVEIREARRANS